MADYFDYMIAALPTSFLAVFTLVAAVSSITIATLAASLVASLIVAHGLVFRDPTKMLTGSQT